jgi:hypothetical protein
MQWRKEKFKKESMLSTKEKREITYMSAKREFLAAIDSFRESQNQHS